MSALSLKRVPKRMYGWAQAEWRRRRPPPQPLSDRRDLCDAELAQFVNDGYIIRRIALPDSALQAARDLAWQHIEPPFERGRPESWHGEITDSCITATIHDRRGRVKLRECVRDEQWLVDLIFKDARIANWIQNLLGPKGGPRAAIRGLYPIFPCPELRAALRGGIDAHPFQVCCIIYLSDVTEDGGAFNLWKGSHRIMRHAFDGEASWTLNNDYQTLREKGEAECERISLPGPAGTVILWHHRCLHQPGANRTRKIRHALIADFLQSDWEEKAKEPHSSDMWEHWPIGN